MRKTTLAELNDCRAGQNDNAESGKQHDRILHDCWHCNKDSVKAIKPSEVMEETSSSRNQLELIWSNHLGQGDTHTQISDYRESSYAPIEATLRHTMYSMVVLRVKELTDVLAN